LPVFSLTITSRAIRGRRHCNIQFQSANAASRVEAIPEVRGHCRRAPRVAFVISFETPERLEQKVDLTIQLVGASLNAESPEKNLASLAEAEAIAGTIDDPIRSARVLLPDRTSILSWGKLREAIGLLSESSRGCPESSRPKLMALPGSVHRSGRWLCKGISKIPAILRRSNTLLEAAREQHEMLMAIVTEVAYARALVVMLPACRT